MQPDSYFFTRLRFKLTERELARDMRNPYEQHRTLWKLFADAPDDTSKEHAQPRSFLFRQNRDPALAKLGLGEFVVISDRTANANSRFTVAVKPYCPTLTSGDVLHFQLRAEVLASKPGKASDKMRGKKHDPLLSALQAAEPENRAQLRKRWLHGAVDENQDIQPGLLLSEWLAPKLSRCGFSLDLPSSRAESYEPVRLKQGSKGSHVKEICFSEADFQGQLRVIDAKLATQAALSGVGHSKAFGCGLLLLRRSAKDTLDG